MKVSVLQPNLLKALNAAGRSVAARAQLPILSNLLLTTEKGRLKISATNLETGINLWLGGKVEKQGTISVPAKILTEFVSNLPSGNVDLEAKEAVLHLSCGNHQAEFVGLPPGEFPEIPTLEGKDSFSMEAEKLARSVGQVAFAAAADEGRPVLTGVLLVYDDSRLHLAATDGYRLSLKKIKVKEKKGFEQFKEGLIIPARALTELVRVMADASEKEVKIAVVKEASQVIFGFEDTQIVSRLIEGNFPEYEKIIPEKGDTRLIVDRDELIRVVRMASIFARESANIIKFQVVGSGKQGKLEVSANTAQVGTNLSEVEIELEGKEGKIAFNSRYLLDFLNSVDGERVRFEMSDPLNPGVFRPEKGSSYLHIIMPVRVQE